MRRVVACVALFVLVVTANAQTGGPAIEGQVVDVSGAGISYAHVIIHPDPAFRREPAQDVVITTDIRGRFVAKVPGGFCDVFVAAPTFKPVAMKVRVLGLEKHSLQIKMLVDPEEASLPIGPVVAPIIIDDDSKPAKP